MTSLFTLFLKMSLRNRGILAILLVMPLVFIGFVAFMTSSGGGINASVYMCVYDSKLKGVVTRLLEQHGISDIHILNECVNDPSKFIFDVTAKTGMPTMLVILSPGRIKIYSSSLNVGVTIKRYLEDALLRFFYPNLKLPVSIMLIIPKTLKSPEAWRQVAYARGIIMFAIMESLFGGLLVVQTVTLLVTTGLHKRIAMFREARRKVALAISTAGLILTIIAGITLFLAAYLVLHVYLRYTLLNPSLWLAYILTYLFIAGLGLIITSLMIRGKTEPATAQSITMMLIFILIFLSGIYMPLEIMPKPIVKIAQLVPITNLSTQAYLSIMKETLSTEKLAYSIVTTSATFILGILLFNPYKKQ